MEVNKNPDQAVEIDKLNEHGPVDAAKNTVDNANGKIPASQPKLDPAVGR